MSSDSPEYQVGPDTTRRCPNCNVRLLENVAICVDCGFDFRSGAIIPSTPIDKPEKTQTDTRAKKSGRSINATIRWFLSTFSIGFVLIGLVVAGLYFAGFFEPPVTIVGSWESKQMRDSVWVFRDDGTFEILGSDFLQMTDPVARQTRTLRLQRRGSYTIEEMMRPIARPNYPPRSKRVKGKWILNLDHDGGTSYWVVTWANKEHVSLHLSPSLNPSEPFGFILYPSAHAPKAPSRSPREVESSTAGNGSDLPGAVTEFPDVASRSETDELSASEPSIAAEPAPTEEREGDDPRELRTWSDSTGKFKIEGTFVSRTTDTVVLRKVDGVDINVPIDRLGEEDRKWIELRVK